jgi:hypothetical protein
VSEERIPPCSHFNKTHGVSIFRNDVYLGELFSHIAFQNAKPALLEFFAHEVLTFGPG